MPPFASRVYFANQEVRTVAGPLQAVVHAAGVLCDATLPQQTANNLRAVFAPKIAGAHRLLQRMSLQPTTSQVIDCA